MPPDRDDLAVPAPLDLGERAVDLPPQGVLRTLERVLGDVEAERFLLDSQPLVLLATPRARWAGGACGGRRLFAPPPRSKIELWPASRSACWRPPAPSACSRTSSMPLRVAPVESSAPHLTSDSSARLFTTCGSTRSQKSQIDSNGPPSSRAATIARTAVSPTFLTAFSPKRIFPSTTAKSAAEHVHVGRQHLDPHLLARGDVERHAVLRVHDRRDERRHVLGGPVRLQVGGAVGDQRVAGGVRLVERVVLRLLHVLPELVRDRRRDAVRRAALEELVLQGGHQRVDLLADRLAEIVRLGRREAGELLGDLHVLLLVDADPVRRAR